MSAPATPERWTFDGELLTTSEVAARVPALSRQTVLKYLRQGIDTTTGMLTRESPARRSAIGRAGKNTALANGFRQRFATNRRRAAK